LNCPVAGPSRWSIDRSPMPEHIPAERRVRTDCRTVPPVLPSRRSLPGNAGIKLRCAVGLPHHRNANAFGFGRLASKFRQLHCSPLY
jgi:hypothetical protein